MKEYDNISSVMQNKMSSLESTAEQVASQAVVAALIFGFSISILFATVFNDPWFVILLSITIALSSSSVVILSMYYHSIKVVIRESYRNSNYYDLIEKWKLSECTFCNISIISMFGVKTMALYFVYLSSFSFILSIVYYLICNESIKSDGSIAGAIIISTVLFITFVIVIFIHNKTLSSRSGEDKQVAQLELQQKNDQQPPLEYNMDNDRDNYKPVVSNRKKKKQEACIIL